MEFCSVEAVCSSCEHIMQYITGFVAESGLVIVDKTGTTLYTDKRYIEAAKKQFEGTDVNPVLYAQKEVLERLKNYKIVGISFDWTAHIEYLAFEKAGIQLVNVDEGLQKAMAVKNEYELSCIKKACEIAEDAFLEVLPEIKAGMTEKQVAALLEYKMRLLGANGIAFDTIVAFGAHAAVPHHVTSDRKLNFGDEILMDFGCRVNGYCSDMTRTFLFGDDGKHEEFKKAYQAVLKAHMLVKENLQSGMTGKQADEIARGYLTEKGYGELFTHSLGHGIGLNVHEYPYLSARGEDKLSDGMVFSDEPGIYVEGTFGIRIEDTITLENGKVKSFMSKTDKNLLIL